MTKYTWLLFFCFSFLSCGQPLHIEYVLEHAGENRMELESFLSYYSKDKQKKQAAEFLLSGMANKHYYVGSLLDKYDEVFQLCDSLNKRGIIEGDPPMLSQIWDSLEYHCGKLAESNMERKLDSRILSANFLIDNVELAFQAWESAPSYVSKELDDFYEFVLPYKANNEMPEIYREKYFKEFAHLRDTVKSGVKGLLLGFNKEFFYNRSYRNSNTLWNYPITFPVSKMEMIHRGACRHTVAFYTWVMRACGLPVAIDFVKSWGNRSQGHEWNVLMLDSGRIFPFDAFGIDRLEFAYKPAKIFRKMYSLNNITEEIPSLKDVPGWLLSPDELDVTTQYGDTYDISVKCTHPWSGDYSKKHGIICVFDNKEWKPVYWGKIKNNKITFLRMMGDVCYMAAYYDRGRIIPATSPFILQKNGSVKYLSIDKLHSEDMVLKRKYPRFKRMEMFAMAIRRGVVEGANDKYFNGKSLLFDIMKEPVDVVDSSVNVSQKFRYVRVRPALYRTGGLAEVQFFGKKHLNDPEQQLSGQIFGLPSISSDITHPYTHAMDNDYETYFDKPKNEEGFIGLDLGTPHYITRVRYCPRSDSNFIVEGHKYELCYWTDEGWISVGKKVATDLTITFDTVPQNTFYILHNLTRGKEERIFTYENEEQIWW